MDVPLGWQTDLAVLRLGHSLVEDHGDHLVVRTPGNPTYHWGNFVLVTAPDGADDAARWLQVFEDAFPAAAHRAVGLVAEPTSDDPWTALGLEVERSDVLVARAPLGVAGAPAGYEARALADPADWEASTRLRETAYPGHGDFERRSTETRAAMAARDEVTWFGAFHGPELVAELGIVPTRDGVARYQSVLAHPDHRRRGLTTHLLGVADARARERGARATVIIADQDSDAGRLYRSAGFVLEETTVQAYRDPAGA